MAQMLLTLNAGSSSIKFALFQKTNLSCCMRGAITRMDGTPHFRAWNGRGEQVAGEIWHGHDFDAVMLTLVQWIETHLAGDTLAAAGHRIVHGGPDFQAPVPLQPETIALLELLSPLAPLHQPHGLNAARALARLRPDLAQFACFDTSFHATIPAVNRRYGLPRGLEDQGIRKFGFHGLSFEFIAGRLREIAPDRATGRIVIAHLGSGASLCALQGGRSVDTSMGYSPLDGLVMATRCGALDPGVVLRLVRDGVPVDVVEDILYRRSGLLGVSGSSGDMRTLLASTDPQAKEAVDLFIFRLAREIAAMAAALDGVDGIVFTAGIGENAPEARRRTADRLAWLGLLLDPAANAADAVTINAADSRVNCWVISTDEEVVIARHTRACLMAQA